MRHDGRFPENLQASIALLCANKGLFDKVMMVNFEPGEYMRNMFFSVSDTGGSEEKLQEVPAGVEPMSY